MRRVHPPPGSAAPVKPLLRGVSHAVAFWFALAGTAALIARSPSGPSARAGLVFGASLAALLGVSALYHRVNWRPAARKRMRRLDHAAIFVLIAGGHTPILALVPPHDDGHRALLVIWAGAALGVVKSLLWPDAPKWVIAVIAVGLGWAAVVPVTARIPIVGATSIGLLLTGGVLYSLGAIVYALRRPNPWPSVFGYHEVFHALVLVASGFLYAHVALVLAAV